MHTVQKRHAYPLDSLLRAVEEHSFLYISRRAVVSHEVKKKCHLLSELNT